MHIYHCPHCGSQTISVWAKFKGHSLNPVVCRECGEGSHTKYTGGGIEALVGQVLIVVVLIASVILKSWVPIFLSTLGYAIYLGYQFHKAPMVFADVEAAKRNHWVVFILLLFVFAFMVYDGFFK